MRKRPKLTTNGKIRNRKGHTCLSWPLLLSSAPQERVCDSELWTLWLRTIVSLKVKQNIISVDEGQNSIREKVTKRYQRGCYLLDESAKHSFRLGFGSKCCLPSGNTHILMPTGAMKCKLQNSVLTLKHYVKELDIVRVGGKQGTSWSN